MKKIIILGLISSLSTPLWANELPKNDKFNHPEQKILPLRNEIARALKEALKLGVDSAVSRVSSLDGFYKDKIIKVLLPQEAASMVDKLNSSRAGRKLYKKMLKPVVNDLVLSMNRAAEDASKKAAPIFLSAIKQMTIPDALQILSGVDTAATTYLHDKTYDSLVVAFQPAIQGSLDKKLVGNQSTSDLWRKFINTYNDVRQSPASYFLSLEAPTEPDLGKYVTMKALDGVFHKVGEEEKRIRENPKARATDLLKDVFGRLGKK